MESKGSSRALRLALAALLLLAGLCVVGAWWLIHRPLPRLHGSMMLPGLREGVTVDRDAWGRPWIRANSLEDLAMAQGYVVAQDRLWQMDVIRRVAAGDIAEIVGPAGLKLDRENRTLGMREVAEAAAARMDPETRSLVEAYARGVNRYIEEHRHALPIEFAMLRYSPRPWTPADTFLVSAYMWKTLTTTWKAKLNRAKITALVGPEKARDLFVIDSPLDHFIVGGPRGSDEGESKTPPAGAPKNSRPSAPRAAGPPPAETEAAWTQAQGLLEQLDRDSSEILGSNNFVVSGAHTYSGKPLLANDTHLGLGMPCIWYLIHLTTPGWNVEGFALPGAPLVIIGHNDRIAWGFTNSNADVQDLYVETFNPSNPNEYRVNGAWVPATIRREAIHVKGWPDDLLDVVVTRHGPIVYRESASEGGRAYALRWTATESGGLDFSYPQLGKAKDWNEFRDVMRNVTGPGQNSVYADVEGNIGFLIAARIPVRKNGNGAVPVSGDTDDYEWTGYIPFDDLPQTLNPPEGIIATANARTVGPSYKYFLTERWAGPSRTARIYELLTGRKDLRPADCNAIQNDIVSSPNRFLAGQLGRASQTREPRDPRTRELIKKLTNWDARAARDSVETSLVEYTRHALFHNLLAPYLNAGTSQYELWEPQSVYNDVWWRDKVFLEGVLLERPAAWLPKPYADYGELLISSADQAVAQLERETGSSDPASWGWGRLHRMDIPHPLGRSGLLHAFLSIGPFPGDGTVDTVKAMGHVHGPAMRFVADLANFDNSLAELSTGESGQYRSRHYRDQFDEWFTGRPITSPFSEAAEERARVHRLRLEPAGNPSSDSNR
jgi:penicillin amidase